MVAAIASRYGTYALKFALLLSAVTDYGRITDNNMIAAIALAGGYKTNALRLFTDRRSHGVTGEGPKGVCCDPQRRRHGHDKDHFANPAHDCKRTAAAA
ncbi:hypothetical protein [Candidatus Amarolinea dominans]|uniref:hypothetical protein n=1 Tax=Candidatus Amarolinea dominans TaxID=3140696 RepID=UPI003134C883|nr:hypothetical protein [Anaerolineae bacterium]